MEYAITKSGGTFLLFGAVLVIAGILLSVWQYKTSFLMPGTPNLPTIPSITGISLPLWFTRAGLGTDTLNLIVIATTLCLFIAGIFTLVTVAQAACGGDAGVPKYEPFQNSESEGQGLVFEMKDRTEKLQAVKDGLERDLESLSTSADDVCAILEQVEDTYITNSSAPTSADEMNLSPDIQERRKADRRKRSVISFKERMKQYIDLNGGKPLYECFENSNESSVMLATQELQNAVRETAAVLNAGEVRMASLKEERIRSLMGFNATFLKKTIDALTGSGKETFANEGKAVIPELTGRSLIQRADEILKEASELHTRVKTLAKNVEIQRKVSAGLDAKAANLGEGNFSSVDVRAASPF